jgi:hypothetical protein
MLRLLAALAATFLCLVAADAEARPNAPAKGAAAKAPKARTPFDASDPAGLIALLAELQAKAETTRSADDSVFLRVTTPAYAFGIQYAGCDARRRACKALAFSTQSDQHTVTLAQINDFNQTSIVCRAFQDRQGKPHVMYATLVSAQDSREAMQAHLGAWQGCLQTFGDFLADPDAFLAGAP